MNKPKLLDQQIINIDSSDASFVVGTGGRTRRKLATVSGTNISIIQDETQIAKVEISGDAASRDKATLYLRYLIQQKHGPVTIDVDENNRDDLTVIMVPKLCVGYITGKKGLGLRTIESDSGTLMFFSQPEINTNSDDQLYKLAIFGEIKNRKLAEFRVMSYIEQKIPGFYTNDISPKQDDMTRGNALDIVFVNSQDLSYAVGKEGNTKRRLCASTGAVIEYIGNFAFIYGDISQRVRARDYLRWLIAQRTSSVTVNTDEREDVTVVEIPDNVIGYVTGIKGNFLRRVEDETGTFIFIDEGRKHSPDRVLIFSFSAFGRQKARDFIERRMYEKLSGYVDNKKQPLGFKFTPVSQHLDNMINNRQQKKNNLAK